MRKNLHNIRKPKKYIGKRKYFVNSCFIIIFGLLLGGISKYLDIAYSNELPYIVDSLDIRNYLGRMSFWFLIAISISIYSNSPLRAGINVMLFFSSMILSYYLYTYFVGNFFPKNYIIIWVVLTILSPIFAFICWYAKGDGNIAIVLSGVIMGIFLSQVIFIGVFYISISYYLDLITWLLCIGLFYKNFTQIFKVILIALIVSIIFNIIFSFGFLKI